MAARFRIRRPDRSPLEFAGQLRYLGGMRFAVIDSPIGPLTVVSGDAGLEILAFGRRIPKGAVGGENADGAVLSQLEEYFQGLRQSFDIPLAPQGTPFQQKVWRALLKIPYGETRSYGEIARMVGKPGAARAVGSANHGNPIAIIVPCHRVIGHDGRLVGYGGGLQIKATLLDLERRVAQAAGKAAGSGRRA